MSKFIEVTGSGDDNAGGYYTGRTVRVNADHIDCVVPRKRGTEIMLAGWDGALRVQEDIDVVMQRIAECQK